MDFATLKLGADTSALKKAEKALDDVAATATGTANKVDGALDKMDASFDDVGASAKQAATGVTAFEKAVQNAGSRIPVANDNIAGMGGQSRLASHHVQNLAFQFQDLGVQLASGANPMTAFIQQGSQISGIMMQAGIGVRGLVMAVVGMVAPFAPAIAVVGGLAAAIGLMTEDINKNSKVTVTWTDTLLGSFDALQAGLGRGIDAAFAAFGTTTTEVWQNVVNATRTAINFVIGAVVALPKAVYDAWTPLIAFADNLFVNVGNAIISRLNGLLSTFGQETFPLMKRSFADGGVGVGDALANSIKDSMSRNWLGDAAAALSPYAQERARKRLEDDAKDAGKKAGEKAGESTVQSLGEYIESNTAKALNSLTKDFKFDDSALKSAGGQLDKMIVTSGETFRTTMEGNLNVFRDVIVGISDLFGQGIGRTINQLGGLLEKSFPEFAASLGKTFAGIGKSIDSVLSGLGSSLGQLGAAAGFGSAVGGLIGGGKGGQIGGAIGGAAGSFAGPIGQIAGSVIGSIIGGLFKGKNPFADVRLSATGSGTLFNQRGGEESAAAGRALGSAFSNELGLIANALGGRVRGGMDFGSIGFSGEQFYFNAQGGDFKGAGAQRFGTAEEALAAAIRNAVDKGAFEGLSDTSKRILASVTEVNADAVVKAVERLNAARGQLVEAYNREAEALGATLARFQGFTASLEAFRAGLAEQLMTPEQIFQQARARFEEISAAASAGNEDAIASLVGVSEKFLSAARDFLTPEEYNREIENVMAAVDLAIVQTKTMEQYAQGQLDALNKSVEGLLNVDNSVISVREAIDNLKGVMEGFAASASGSSGGSSFAMFPQGGAYDGMGPMANFDPNDPASFMSYTVSADEATREELIKQNEYLRELVRISAKQERTLQEIQIQGEAVA